MKATRAIVVALAVLAAMSSAAQANLILIKPDGTAATTVAQSFTDIGAQGFGNNPWLLTIQTKGIETVSVTPINVNNGDAVPNSGGNKSNTPTLSELEWTSGNKVGVGFNPNQSGQTGITMQSLTLTI